MTKSDSAGKTDFQKRRDITRLCGLAWSNICHIADHRFWAVDRPALAREAYVAISQASTLCRSLAGEAAKGAASELGRGVFLVVGCIESRLYPRAGKLHPDFATALAAEWLLIELLRIVVQAEALNEDDLDELQSRIPALHERAAGHLAFIQQCDPEVCSRWESDRPTAEYNVRYVIAGLEDLDTCIEVEMEDA